MMCSARRFSMVDNSIAKIYRSAKRLIVYEPPQENKPFVLAESTYDSRNKKTPPPPTLAAESLRQLHALTAYARKLALTLEKATQTLADQPDKAALAQLADGFKPLERQYQELTPLLLAYTSGLDPANCLVSSSLGENKHLISGLYHTNINKDLLLRDFTIADDPARSAMLVFLDGMVDQQLIDLTILQPLMRLCPSQLSRAGDDLLQTLASDHLPNTQAAGVNTFRAILDGVNSGDTVLFVDGTDSALILSTKGFKQRGVERPQIEQSVRGSQAAFSEGLRINTGLMRSILPTHQLVTEILIIGSRVPQKCAVMYLQNLANSSLVAEVKRRINATATDHVLNAGMLEQFIEDHPGNPFPQSLSTERPDRTAAALLEGRVALLYEGSPFAHILPVTFFTFFHSADDFTLTPLIANFLRLLRLTGALISLVFPSAYLAISSFHPEALPTELVLAIAGAREKVPFPTIFELIIMEMSFEFIREAGLRIPGMLGSTIGIVGAIILGQAAVTAQLVSPVMVVVIAITGLASFTIPDYRMASTLRVIRFAYLLLGATFGLIGVAFALLLTATILCSMKSFGVPYLSPIAPKTMSGLDVIIRGSVARQQRRGDALNTKDNVRQPANPRQWTVSGGKQQGEREGE